MKDSLKGSYYTSISKGIAKLPAGIKVSAIVASLIATFLFAPPALATDKASDIKMKGPRTQQVDFEESAVNGQVRRPDGFLLNKRSDPTLSPLFNAKKSIEERIQKSNFILK